MVSLNCTTRRIIHYMTTIINERDKCFSMIFPSTAQSSTTPTKCLPQLIPKELLIYGTSTMENYLGKSIKRPHLMLFAGELTLLTWFLHIKKHSNSTAFAHVTFSNSTSAVTLNTYLQSLSHKPTYIASPVTELFPFSITQHHNCYRPLRLNRTQSLVLESLMTTLPGSFLNLYWPLKRKSQNWISSVYRGNTIRLRMVILKTVSPGESICTFA